MTLKHVQYLHCWWTRAGEILKHWRRSVFSSRFMMKTVDLWPVTFDLTDGGSCFSLLWTTEWRGFILYHWRYNWTWRQCLSSRLTCAHCLRQYSNEVEWKRWSSSRTSTEGWRSASVFSECWNSGQWEMWSIKYVFFFKTAITVESTFNHKSLASLKQSTTNVAQILYSDCLSSARLFVCLFVLISCTTVCSPCRHWVLWWYHRYWLCGGAGRRCVINKHFHSHWCLCDDFLSQSLMIQFYFPQLFTLILLVLI